MSYKIINFIAFIFYTFLFFNILHKVKAYDVPEPEIKVYSNGFTVSVPDEDGISLFAFHGNINRPMQHLEAGQFSQDILRKKGDRWVFKNADTKLKVGDKIYYWLYVLRDGLGHRYDHGEFTVKDILEENIPEKEFSRNVTSSNKTDSSKSSSNVNLCLEQIKTISQVNEILYILASKDPSVARTLKLSGEDSQNVTAREFVVELITKNLEVTDVIVIDAERGFDNVITFTVKSLEDKVKLILASQEKLKGSKYQFVW
ncbi:uncharacterized protein LOC115888792 [Sitophilus oryzae]|uniref:Uncharacterized protein LOC115888792 n=1 Tax=Sitophilus oryzae TaxID=7048 RepID=A0A6J2YNX2_SITOR|nr:uncharacterized protein LOC115888792 [Sitophilus oryzae]